MLAMISFLFASFPPPLTQWAQWLWVMLAVLLIAGSIAVPRMLVRRKLRAFEVAPWRRLARLLLVTGITLWVLLFFRVEAIPVFGARFWLAMLAILDLVWFWHIAQHARTRVPQQRRSMEERQAKEKYLP